MSAPVRLTVHPGEDVLLPAGVPFSALREPLANLLRRPELRHARLLADGVEVGPGSVAGERPLLPGAVVRADVGPRFDVVLPCVPSPRTQGSTTPKGGLVPMWSDDAARGAPTLVARTTGADAGELAGLWPGTRLVLPGGAVVRMTRRGRVRVRASALSRRPSGTPRSGGHALPAALRRRRSLGALARPGGRRRRVGLLGRRWRSGEVLEAGAHYTLHASGDAGTLLDGLASAPAAPPTSADMPSLANALATALLPGAGSIVLAVTLRQPGYALFALVGVLAAIPQLAGAVRRRRAGAVGTTPSSPAPPGPAATATRGLRPDLLARGALAAWHASDQAWRDALRMRAPGSALAPTPPPPLLPDRAIAVRGPEPETRALARAIVAEVVARGAAVRATGGARDAWDWCRWFDGEGAVLVVDSPAPADLDAAHAASRMGVSVVLRLPAGAPLPPWCRTVLDVDTTGAPARVRRSHPGGGSSVEPLVGVGAAWADRFARRVAGARGLGRDVGALWAGSGALRDTALPPGADPTDPRLPTVVPLTSLVAVPSLPTGQSRLSAIERRHRAALPTPGSRGRSAPQAGAPWAVPLGVDAEGRAVTFDLVQDGPHLLVAGTTGSGKSELLQAFVLALALGHTPDDLALALVDFKGGASFGACAGLPHVVGLVTDLEVGLAARALEGLRAELRHRKGVLAAHGVSDVTALPPGTLPRLVVVFDEFRALADDLPELLPGLLRVAAQGRSLGVHVVLATQRPAGAVSADVRANVSARLALRVVDAADSHDVIDSPAAAHVPPGVPGRAVLRVGSAAPVALQCAYAGADDVEAIVRRAPTWADLATGRPAATHTAAGTRSAGDHVAALVTHARTAADDVASPRWPAPWLPPLPATISAGDLGPAAAGALPLALGDAPAARARVPVAWDPAAGHLAVLGRARSGRSTALRSLAQAALAAGWHVHALVPRTTAATLAPLTAHPGFGTVAGPDDPRRAARLLRLLGRPAPGSPPSLVVVDGLEALRSALASPTDDPLATALVAGGAAFAVSAESAGLAGLSARFGPRLVLLSADAAADSMLGAPTPFAGRGRTPGRGVWLAEDDPLECQVALPVPTSATGGTTAPASNAGSDGAGHAPLRHVSSERVGIGAPEPVRVREIPRAVTAAHLAGGPPDAIGLGGDGASPVGVDLTRATLVVGPRGTGRTTALRLLLGSLTATDEPVVIARDRALVADATRRGARVIAPTPAALRALVGELAEVARSTERGERADLSTPAEPAGPADRETPSAADTPGRPTPRGERTPTPRRPIVFIDDADALAQAAPLEVDALADLADDGAVTLVASATTLAAAMAHRGLLAHLRASRTGIVLAPAERGADEVFGVALDDAAEPGVRWPGRGALVADGVVSAVQLAAPRPAEPSDDAPSLAGPPQPAGHTQPGEPPRVSAASSPRPRAA